METQPMDNGKIQAGARALYEVVTALSEQQFNTHELAQSLVAVAIDVMVTDLGFGTARKYFADVAISIERDHPLSRALQTKDLK